MTTTPELSSPVVINPDATATAPPVDAFFHAWMEDAEWDGWAMYTDLRTAMEVAAAQYADDEYPFRSDDDGPDARPGQLAWVNAYGSWHLTDGGVDTMIRITRTMVYGPAAPATEG